MAKLELSTKRILIDKANSTIVIVTAVASFIVVFSLIASKALVSQRSYQNKVIAGKEKAVKQLKTNIDSVNQLVTSYKSFVSTSTNVIGGSATGSGDRDGDNAKIVLDALPSKYDFPALTTSLEKIIKNGGFKLNSIVGTDDEINQAAKADESIPEPVEMPFQIGVTGNFNSIKDLLSTLERSIRPFYVDKIEIGGTDSNLTIGVTAKSYYQPEKALNIQSEAIK